MIQVTYISTAARDIDEGMIDAILRSSQRNNAAAGITGLLLYNGRRFLQTLEGDEAAVRRAYERISLDQRHRAVVLLGSRSVEDRSFPNWAMAAQRASNTEGTGDLKDQVAALTTNVADANVRDHFRSFARLASAA